MGVMADDLAPVPALTVIDGSGLTSGVSKASAGIAIRAGTHCISMRLAGRIVRCEDGREPALNSLCAQSALPEVLAATKAHPTNLRRSLRQRKSLINRASCRQVLRLRE
jgi:hypothetical protein